jgi:hypothetical protein
MEDVPLTQLDLPKPHVRAIGELRAVAGVRLASIFNPVDKRVGFVACFCFGILDDKEPLRFRM